MKRRVAASKTSRQGNADSRWIEQRERLLHAAQRAIHRGGPHVSMDEIAAEAGITKPIVYRHFGDRRGLARALRDAVFARALGTPAEDASRNHRAARERVASFYPVVSDPDDLRRVIVRFATGFQMFVEVNGNLYRFFRAEGVVDSTWSESDDGPREDPMAESFAASLLAVFADRGIDEVTARVWGNAIRGMMREVVQWSAETAPCDRFELEGHFELLARTVIAGLGDALAERAARKTIARRPRTARTRGGRRPR
jgi:AcrR family transcriptional regulator